MIPSNMRKLGAVFLFIVSRVPFSRVQRLCTRHQMTHCKNKLFFSNFTYQEGDTKEDSDSSAEVIGDAAKGIGANQQPCQV